MVEAALVVVPPDGLARDSSTRSCRTLLRIRSMSLASKNANLRQTRDLLLPRLVSGEVDVGGVA